MEKEDTITFLENLPKGKFCTVNIPITKNKKVPITAMYVGKDNEGRYKFIDTGKFVLSKDILVRSLISIEKNFDKNQALNINAKIKIEKELKQKQKLNQNIR